MSKASGGGGDGVVDAATIAVAAHGAMGVPALAASLCSAADAKPLAAVTVSKAGQDLLGRKLGDLIWKMETEGIRAHQNCDVFARTKCNADTIVEKRM